MIILYAGLLSLQNDLLICFPHQIHHVWGNKCIFNNIDE